MHLSLKLLLLAMSISAANASAFTAAEDTWAAAPVPETARISLAQAVDAAPRHADGRASRAEYSIPQRGGVYDEEMIRGVQVHAITIDTARGAELDPAEHVPGPDDGNGRRD